MPHCRQERAPRKKPDQDQEPERGYRQRFIIQRLAATQKSKKVLVHKKIPEKARIAPRNQKVPGNCQGQEQQGSLRPVETLQPVPIFRLKKEEQNDGKREE